MLVAKTRTDVLFAGQVVISWGSLGAAGGFGGRWGRGNEEGAGGGVWRRRTARATTADPYRVLQIWKSELMIPHFQRLGTYKINVNYYSLHAFYIGLPEQTTDPL